MKELEPQLEQVEAELSDLLARTPNVPHESAPDGFTDEDAVEVRRHGEPPAFEFEPRDHAVLGELLGMLDTERGARTSGRGSSTCSATSCRCSSRSSGTRSTSSRSAGSCR